MQEIRNKQIPQKKLEEKVLPQKIKETSQQRHSSRFRNQPQKDKKKHSFHNLKF